MDRQHPAAKTTTGGAPVVSVVIPICNEFETLPELRRRLEEVLAAGDDAYEIIFVNDGSVDGSLERLTTYARDDARIKLIDLSRNFGHQAAMYAGLRRATGEALILMDGDLQDPPEVIPQLVSRWREGFDVVVAVRRKRKEGLWKRLLYAGYYRLLRQVAYIRMPLDAGDFSLLDANIVGLLKQLPERNKFLRGLRAWAGFRQTELEYERSARFAGEPKYTTAKLIKLALDGLISYSYVPLRISYALGLAVSVASFGLATVYFFQRLFSEQFIPQGFTTLAILVLFLGGVQLLSLGVLGEYVARIYDEVKHRPEYVEREVIGFNEGR
jgi:dolichol-phosphate mannosyltransferase